MKIIIGGAGHVGRSIVDYLSQANNDIIVVDTSKDKLETIAKEALNKIKYNSLENIRLSEIRDTLLPKLMSGELKINEIDC